MKTTSNIRYRAVVGLCAVAALTMLSCGEPYTQTGWATTRITAAFCQPIEFLKGKPAVSRCQFPQRDLKAQIVPAGETVSHIQLEKGRQLYMHYCYACHGVNGDGTGPASHGLRPPPRDFRIQTYKFAAVKEGLPNDWDFQRIIKGGLHGSAMLEWDITESELDLVIDFIKTFPPPPCEVPADLKDAKKKAKAEAKCKKHAEKFPNGEPNAFTERLIKDLAKPKRAKATGYPIVVPAKDPYEGNVEGARAAGSVLYHMKAQCVNCHPAYITKTEYAELQLKDGKKKATFREDLYYSVVIKAKANPYNVNIMPPDFTMNPLRSIRKKDEWGGPTDQVKELWRLIAAGIGTTGMPAWKDSLTDKEIWALSHYVSSLMDLRRPENRAKLLELQTKLDTHRYKPAAPPAAPPPKPPPPPKEEDGKDEDKDGEDKDGEDKDGDPTKEAPKDTKGDPLKDAPKDTKGDPLEAPIKPKLKGKMPKPKPKPKDADGYPDD